MLSANPGWPYITGAEIPVDGGHSSHGGTKSIMDALGYGFGGSGRAPGA